MAKFFPTLEIIKGLKPAPTEGEWKLLRFLADNYNDEYEVFFQPFLNEARPDIVVMRKGGGVMIFEVKDWDLSNYRSTPTGTWIVRPTGERMRYTPIRQVHSYKEKLYSLNCWELFSKRSLQDDDARRSSWALVNCAVFFHGSTEAQVKDLCFPPDITDKNRNFLKYIELLGDDSLTQKKIDGIFYRKYLSRKSYRFTDKVYDELFRLFKPDFHTVEQGLPFELSPAQKILSESVAGARKRIKGVAGAGKSFVLARRAVNAHKRTGGDVLILTYNITLKNYLHNRISEVRENFNWRHFHIENYHQHFNAMLAECNMTVPDVARAKWPDVFRGDNDESDETASRIKLTEAQLDAIYADGSVFKENKDQIRKYDVVLIDEAQDYQEEWVRIIMEYAATEDAEIVAFADEKQNVYERELDANRFPVIPITTGPWDMKLNTTYRLNTEIANLSVMFQSHFFSNKYAIDDNIEPSRQLELIFDRAHIEYRLLPSEAERHVFKDLSEYILSVRRCFNLHANDLTVLSSSMDFARELSHAYAELSSEKVNCMCETPDEFEKTKGDKVRLKEIRRFKKQNFWQNTGSVSFSSIHSFKGLETPAMILIVGNGVISDTDDSRQSDIKLVKTLAELAYVGITRTRNYLFVINFGDPKIDEFFNSANVRDVISSCSLSFEKYGEVRHD